MIIINPQWQGIGHKNPVPQGAEYIQALLKDYNPHHVPLDNSDLEDIDNVKGLPQITALVEKTAAMIEAESPNKIFTCGGDCSSDYAQLAYLNDKYNGDFTLIWIDAHADLNTPESSPSKNFHGMTLRCLTGDGPISLTSKVKTKLNPDQFVFSGLRSIDPEETRYLEEHNIPVFTTAETRGGAIENTTFAHPNLYIHVDIDSLDESVFNHCATPTSGGFMLDELVELIKKLRSRYNVIGGCLTEYGPRDHGAAGDIVETLLFKGFEVQDEFAVKLAA